MGVKGSHGSVNYGPGAGKEYVASLIGLYKNNGAVSCAVSLDLATLPVQNSACK